MSTSKTNIKTVILATIKTPLAALFTHVDAVKKSVFDHTAGQDDAITQLQSHVADLQESTAKILTEMLKFNSTVTTLENAMYTADQVKALENRVRDLNWISSQLYDIVYELKLTGVTEKPMPDFDKPIITREELLVQFKEANDLDADHELTEAEVELFENFITQWFIDNPGHILEENLES